MGAWDIPMMPCYNRDFSTASHAGVTFCLPRNRTIFDINIEAFEQKLWRLHGAEMTEYFNFGLDEESWKSYWESLPKGRAIQVEGSLGERLPSTDVRHPRILDSDVVIQINMEGSAGYESALCKNSLEHRTYRCFTINLW